MLKENRKLSIRKPTSSRITTLVMLNEIQKIVDREESFQGKPCIDKSILKSFR